jgi:hypothetical protein
MIGYIQNMDPDNVLTQVNVHAANRTIPSLTRAAGAWATQNVTQLSNRLARQFDPRPIDMNHLWIDLRHCTFVKPTAQMKVVKKSKAAKKTSPRKARGQVQAKKSK